METENRKQKAVKFTDRFIRGLPPPTAGRKDYFRYDATVRGLSVRVTASGGKAFNFKHGGGPRIPIGPFPSWTVAKAQAHARVLIGRISNGEDVVGEHRTKQMRQRWLDRGNVLTVADALEAYARDNPRKAKPDHFKHSYRILERVLGAPTLKRPLDELTEDMIRAALRACQNKAPGYARRAEVSLRAVLKWANEELKIPNPLAERRRIIAPLPARQVFLSEEDMQQRVVPAAKTLGWPAGPLMLWLMTTGVRRSEAAGTRWREFNSDFTEWTIPAERMKGGIKARTHWVPLPIQLTEMIKNFPRFADSPYVFTLDGKRPTNSFTHFKRRLDSALTGSDMQSFRVHDFRRTLATWASKEEYETAVAQIALGHRGLDKVSAIYNPYEFRDQRRKLLQHWADVLFGAAAKPSVPATRNEPPLEGEVLTTAQLLGLGQTNSAPAEVKVLQIASNEDAYWLMLETIGHSEKPLVGLAKLYRLSEKDYRQAFLDAARQCRSTPAQYLVQSLLNSAVGAALRHIASVTDRDVEEARERLERDLVLASGREERYRAEAALAREMSDDSAQGMESKAEAAAKEVAEIRRQIDALPGLNHPLRVKHTRHPRQALSEGVQKALFEFLHNSLVQPNHHKTLVTEIANAATDGVVARFTLREDRRAWRSE
jgi:integrase